MDRDEHYREIVRGVIRSYAALKPSYGDIEVETIFDETNGHYELMYAGWHGNHRIHGAVLHVDVKNGKVWIQHDGIEEGITPELLEAGIPREHIVLGFQPPHARKLTDFAVG